MEGTNSRVQAQSLYAHVESKIEEFRSSKVDEVAQEVLNNSQSLEETKPRVLELESIAIYEESKGEELDRDAFDEFKESVGKTKNIAQLFNVIKGADPTIQETLLNESGAGDFDNLVTLIELKEKYANLPLQTVAAPTLGKVVEKRKTLQSKQSSGNQPAEEISDYIRNKDQPGPFIQSLEALRESFVSLYQAASGKQELPSEEETTAALKSNSTTKSEKEAYERAFQAHSTARIENCMLENTKLLLFADNEDERRKEYEKFASMLYKIIGPSKDEYRQTRIENAFALGEGSLCELSSVCKTGWEQRIKVFVPWQSSGDKRDLSSFVLDICNLEKRSFISGLLLHQFQSDVHCVKEGLRICNEMFALGITDEELGDLEYAVRQYVSENIDRESFIHFFEENFTFDGVKQRLREQFDQLSGEDKQLFIDTLTELYGQSLRKNEGQLIDEMQSVREACEQAKEDNRNTNPTVRTDALAKRRTEFANAFGVFIFSLIPKRVEDALIRVMNTLRGAFPWKMMSFRLPGGYEGFLKLRDQCNTFLNDTTINEEKKKIVQDQKDAISKFLPENTDIDGVINPDELEIAFLQEHQKEVEKALDNSVPVLIREQNVQTFKRALTDGSRTSLSEFGAVMLLLASGVSEPSDASDSPSNHLAKTLAHSLQEAETLKTVITDVDRALGLLEERSDKIQIIEFCSPEIRPGVFDRALEQNLIEGVVEIIEKFPELLEGENHEIIFNRAHQAIEKCDPSKVSSLIKLLPENIKSEQDFDALAKHALNKYSPALVPQLIKLLPENFKSRNDFPEFANAALERCDQTRVRALFSALPEKVTENLEFAKKALEKCDPSRIPSFIVELPEKLKGNLEFAEKALEHCDPFAVVQLIQQLPEPIMEDENFPQFVKDALEKCDPYIVLDLVRELTDRIKEDDLLVNLALMKYNGELYVELVKILLPPKTDTTFARIALHSCKPADLENLTRLLSPALKDDPTLANVVLEKLDLSNVLRVVSLLDDSIKSDQTFANTALEKCGPRTVLKLIKEFPPQIKENPLFANTALEKCDTCFIHLLIKEFPEHIKENPRFANSALEKCDPSIFLRVVKFLGNSIKSDLTFVNAALEKCAPEDFFNLIEILPIGIESRHLYISLAEKSVRVCGTTRLINLVKSMPEHQDGQSIHPFAEIALLLCEADDMTAIASQIIAKGYLPRDRNTQKISNDTAKLIIGAITDQNTQNKILIKYLKTLSPLQISTLLPLLPLRSSRAWFAQVSQDFWRLPSFFSIYS